MIFIREEHSLSDIKDLEPGEAYYIGTPEYVGKFITREPLQTMPAQKLQIYPASTVWFRILKRQIKRLFKW